MTLKDMLGRSGVISREDALKTLEEHFTVPHPQSEIIHISHSLGRVLAEEIRSPENLPEFDRSTMDGYAVRSADTFGAAESRPALLTVVGDILMGTMPERGIGKGEVMKIATGGALPLGADAVVMFEQTQPVDEKSIEVVKAVAPQENVSRVGDDMRKGETVLGRGHVIRPQDMGALASMGFVQVPVFEKPRIAIISTGNELVPADTVPGPGRIRDSNSYNLEGLIASAGGMAVRKGILPDDYDRLREALKEAMLDCHIILFTGGSSVGTADYTARVINDLGPPGVLVHGVSIKPGKPIILGVVKEKRTGVAIPVFGLPGHQAAVSICFDVFVKPVLTRFTGAVPDPTLEGIPPYRTVKAKLARSIPSAPGREDHVRVTLEKKDGQLWARPIFGASGLISTLVKAVGTVVVPLNMIGIEVGEEVEVRLF
ncbi:MAG: molybdopterin molybdotransferase MoeA [Nitrospirae bacterium]|nr:molybdopterin molybdotransferase MoeA [Nitrospirota bacterium]